jgi:hypothetical protein
MITTRLVSENIALAASSWLERMTGIEPALSAWESARSAPDTVPDQRRNSPVSDRETPLITGVNGTLMARHSGPDLRRPRTHDGFLIRVSTCSFW